jgi:hypothetical protein
MKTIFQPKSNEKGRGQCECQSPQKAVFLIRDNKNTDSDAAPPDSHLVLGCGGLYGDSLGPTARPCIVYYLMCVLS